MLGDVLTPNTILIC